MRSFPTPESIRCTLLAAVLAVGAAGCYKATFISSPNVVRGADHDQWNSFFLWGLVGEETLDVRQFCSGTQVAQVRTGANVLTGLVSVVTLGIYTPRMAYVWCAAPPGAPVISVELDKQHAPPADARMLAIYADRHGRPVRVELRRGDALESVVEPTPIVGEASRWHVAFDKEVPR